MTASETLAVFSTLHRGTAPFISEFLEALGAQTDRDFTLWLAVDDVPDADCLLRTATVPIFQVRCSGTPTEVRLQALKELLRANVSGIILVDADDVPQAHHVETCRRRLLEVDIVAADLRLWEGGEDSGRPWLSKRLGTRRVIHTEDLLDSNCLGGGNTAVRPAALANALHSVPRDAIAFDWALFARMLLSGARALFVDEVSVNYRQYAENMAGPLDLSEASILQGVAVKARHYAGLEGVGAAYRERARSFSALQESLASSVALREAYCSAVRTHATPCPLWWESIRTLDSLGVT